MKNKKTTAQVFWGLSILFAVVSTLLRTLCMTSYYDMHQGYYQLGATLPTVLNITTAAFAAILFCSVFVLKGCDARSATKLAPLNIFPSVLMAAIFAIKFVFYFISSGIGDSPLEIAMTLLALFSAVYFLFDFLAAKKENEKTKDLKAFLGLLPMAWYLSLMLSVYFDRSLPTNSPTKSYAYLTVISAIFFLIYECHLGFGKKQGNIYIAMGCISTVLCFSLSIPHIVCSNLAEKPFLLSALHDIVILASGIYSAVKTYAFMREIKSTDEDNL